MPRANSPCKLCFKFLVTQVPVFLRAPTQAFKNLVGALVIAIPKPNNPLGNRKSYRPISLLCVCFKILERLIYARTNPIIDPLLLRDQSGFRPGRLIVDQVTLLIQETVNSFLAKRRPALCLSISKQPTILYGIAASLSSQSISIIKDSCLHFMDSCGNLNQDTRLCLLHWNC